MKTLSNFEIINRTTPFLKTFLNILILLSSLFASAQTDSLKLKCFQSKNQKVCDTLQKNFKNVPELKTKLEELGYFNYTLTKKDSTINIDLKNKINVITITSSKESQETLKIEEQVYIPFIKLKATINEYRNKLLEQGYSFAKIKINPNSINKDTLYSYLKLTVNKKRYIDKIKIEGYSKFSKSHLKYYLKIKEGDELNIKDVKQKLNRIKNLRFANNKKDPEIKFTKDSTTLFIYLNKKKNNAFDGYLGFNNNETSDLQITGNVNLQLNNNLNYGETLSINYRNENKQRLINVNTEIPYLFNSPISTENSLNIFTRDSIFNTTRFKSSLYYTFSNNLKIKANYTQASSTEINPSNNTSDFTNSFISATTEYTAKNLILSLDIGTGSRNIKNAKTKQLKTTALISYTYNFNNNHQLSIKNQLSYLDSNNYITNELFRTGGINTLRGFNDYSIEGELINVLNLDYKYKLDNNFLIGPLVDFGHIENSILRGKQRFSSFGISLITLTKSGLLNLTIANGRSLDNKISFQNTKAHISLKTRF